MARKKRGLEILIVILVLIVAGYGYYSLFEREASREEPGEDKAITTFIPDSTDTLTIMNWNIQTFGLAKWDRPEAKKKILEIVPQADIVFIQEIRERTGVVFNDLCNYLNHTHKCDITSRAGRTSSKEQYGVIYKKDIEVLGLTDFNPDTLDRWERPPVVVSFKVDDYEFLATNIHIRPDDVVEELEDLEMLYMVSSVSTNRIWLGDFNADCSYYDENNKTVFKNKFWVIRDYDDTAVSGRDCAYDRIILNSNMEQEYIRYGIYKNITSEVSDHYPVWVEIKAQEVVP